MDKNTIIGLILIFLIIIGFSYLNRPSPEQLEARKRYQDSISWVRMQEEAAREAAQKEEQSQEVSETSLPDSVAQAKRMDRYGSFSVSIQGTEEFATLENKWMEIKLSSKGGRIYSVRLKDYTDYRKEPLFLFDEEESAFGVTFITANNRVLNTSDFYFQIIPDSAEQQATLRLNAGEDKSMDFVYTLHPEDYMLDFKIVPHNLQTEFSPAMRTLDVQWMQKIRQQEQGRQFEERYARLTYKFVSDDVEQLRETKDDMKNISNKLKWIGYKDQFFSSVLVAGENFESAKLDSRYFAEGKYLKEYNTYASVPFNTASVEPVEFKFIFGPNDYYLLKRYDKTIFAGEKPELEKLVPLGWSLVRPINKYIVLPVFGWLTSWCGSLGLAIFFLTLIIRGALFPLTYKSLISSAKMRVLKPQIEVITAKYPGQENAMARQQKTMELYRQVGVNPMAGCLPMLIQFPFLIALFMLFPSAIELRHQSFLWADDLSTYDGLIHWSANIPFISKYLGNHISIFCLLMTLVTILNTKYMADQQNTGQEQMPGMKMMMYFMPVVMFFFLNSYPAGLNYYYLVSTLITIGLTILFRFTLDEKKLLAKLEANKHKAKPAKKKSGFMARLEEAQRKQQALLKEQQKKNNTNKRR
ncbi:MAG: membrane protein insertase YidC [Candidatus Azobacteroides sp.]|nr:membrane protein insertase YidC [Candidatus Azobacteroides sp.]